LPFRYRGSRRESAVAQLISLGHIRVMKRFAIVLGVLALIFLGAHFWLGPVYQNYDGCTCGLRRTWVSFDEAEITRLHDCKLFVRITSPGDPNHHHEYYDAQYSEHPIFGYAAFILGFASVVLGFYPRHQARKISECDHVV
jgi:hypothetical protein